MPSMPYASTWLSCTTSKSPGRCRSARSARRLNVRGSGKGRRPHRGYLEGVDPVAVLAQARGPERVGSRYRSKARQGPQHRSRFKLRVRLAGENLDVVDRARRLPGTPWRRYIPWPPQCGLLPVGEHATRRLRSVVLTQVAPPHPPLAAAVPVRARVIPQAANITREYIACPEAARQPRQPAMRARRAGPAVVQPRQPAVQPWQPAMRAR